MKTQSTIKSYQVHRCRFATEAEARQFATEIHARTRIIVAITASQKQPTHTYNPN